ncbi:monocarboxylate transporter 14 [Bombyx mori]|uniref:Major facilitator superfamily (MFS) profile domain-containing protein n=1 Tax=Bombyx mori TaxID=7091 RepID=A0A8R2C5H0_BOMMO|nr:monocarboxylate transporter 14 [Bombyx mori]
MVETDGTGGESTEKNSKIVSNNRVINNANDRLDHDVIAQYTKETEPELLLEKVKFEGLDDEKITRRDAVTARKIPDGGWGWVVVASAFLVSACADGLAFSFGLLHERLTSYFNTTQSKTSLIGSLFIATPLLAGPVMSALVDRYGCRVMTIIAGLLSTVGFLLAAVSNSIGMLCLTYGFISGLAMGIMYVTAVVSVAFWFDKRRNLAVSLASCGVGFGTLLYSPMTSYFLELYDWRSTIILLAGTLLNMCVCGALMRDPEWLIIKQERERRASRSKSRSASLSSRASSQDSLFLGADEIKSLLESGQSPEYILATLASSIAEAEELESTTQANVEQSFKRMHSAIQLPTFIQQKEKVPPEVMEKLMHNKKIYNIIVNNYPDLIARRKSEASINVESPTADVVTEAAVIPVEIQAIDLKASGSNAHNTEDKKKTSKETNKAKDNAKNQSKTVPPQQNWFRQISMDHHYLRDVPLYRNTMMRRGAMMSIQRYRLRAASLPDMYKNTTDSESDDESEWYERFVSVLKSTFDFRMFTEFHFLMFNLSSLILSVWFIVPYFFLNSYMSSQRMDGGATMISIIGVASSIGIVALGWAGDQPWINVTKTYAVCLIICGFSVAAYPLFITNYWALTVISTVFGLSFASSYSYTPTILMELMPIDHFTVAYGLILLSQGIGHLVGPPLGGLLYDLTGAWDLTFYVGGVWLVVSGLCVGVIPYTKDKRMCGAAPLLKESTEVVNV